MAKPPTTAQEVLEILREEIQEEMGVPGMLYLISYDIKAKDEAVYDRIHEKIQKKLDEIKAKKVLKSQRAVRSRTPIVKLCSQIIGVLSERDKKLVELLITPFSVKDSARYGVSLEYPSFGISNTFRKPLTHCHSSEDSGVINNPPHASSSFIFLPYRVSIVYNLTVSDIYKRRSLKMGRF